MDKNPVHQLEYLRHVVEGYNSTIKHIIDDTEKAFGNKAAEQYLHCIHFKDFVKFCKFYFSDSEVGLHCKINGAVQYCCQENCPAYNK